MTTFLLFLSFLCLFVGVILAEKVFEMCMDWLDDVERGEKL